MPEVDKSNFIIHYSIFDPRIKEAVFRSIYTGSLQEFEDNIAEKANNEHIAEFLERRS